MILGILAVVLAYFSAADTSDPWTSLNTAGVTATLYLLVLLATILRKPFEQRARALVWIAVLIVGAAWAIAWTTSEDYSRYRGATLSGIREEISRGIIADEISRPLLSALEEYYAQKGRTTNSLGLIFKRLNPNAAVGRNIHVPSFDADHLTITVAALAENEIVLIAEEGYVKGVASDFRNLSGATGMVQERARLTPQGIVYESEN